MPIVLIEQVEFCQEGSEMDQKKLNVDDVTQTGWWRQQRVPKKKSAKVDDKNVTDTVSSASVEGEQDPTTQSTISRVLSKLDIF